MLLREIITHVPCTNCGFYVIFNNVKQRFKKYKLTQSLLSPSYFNITDAKSFVETYSCVYKDKPMIVWIDTPYYVERGCNMRRAKVYVTSHYVKKLLNGIIHVDGVLRPPFNQVVYDERGSNVKKEYLFTVLASEPGDDTVIRKRVKYTLDILRQLNMRNSTLVISNVGDFDMRSYTLDEREKYRLLHKSYFYLSLSKNEGFGLPLMEAMSVGTPAVYVNAFAFKEYAVGIPIDPYDVIVEETPYGKMDNYLIHDNDVRNALQEARECIKTSCYDDLSVKALKRSKEFEISDIEEKILSDLKSVMRHR
ncbi:lipothrixviral glycosyltransferase [Sulfolobus islandicus filamentous virus 2]|uniref:Lipothrixviral glycosyltransferase n=1 Tax=Sulfolobus islandicus filamentous virus 2 TaxID=1902331 RepID=A0A1D8BJA3_SIFV|nr:lipothrixviral glycosyltransferase [Sulfolobus islandicus filamentous virus 2]